MSNQRYSPEFKDEAVRQIVDRGYSVAEVSERLGVSAHSLYKWVKAIKPDKTDEQAAALVDRRPPPGCIHHTDRGSQYGAQPDRKKRLCKIEKLLRTSPVRGSIRARVRNDSPTGRIHYCSPSCRRSS